MKSKRRKRVIASVLCMVLMLSTGISTLAEADAGAVPVVEEKTAVQTTTQETESTSTETKTVETETQAQAETETQTETKQTEEAAQTEQEETTAAQPTEEASSGETTQTEQTTAENAKAVQTQENNQNTAQDTQTTTSQQNVAESEENLTEKDSTAASGSSEKEEASVLNTAMLLKKEWKDAEGTVKERVTANIPEGAFQAENSDITMTVKKVTGDRSTEIQELMKDRLPENSYLGEFFLYDIQFEVAGEKVEPQKAITFTFEGNDITADDSKRVNVFYMDPSDSRKLVEITQKSEMLETLKNQGKSTANIDDYDLSEVSIKDGKIESATAEGKLATVYGCYVEAFSKEVVLTKTVDGTTVKLTAPEGAFPMDSEKVQMEVKALTEEQEKVIEEKLEEQKVEDYVAFDINLLADGKTIQPQIPVKVTFENAGLDVKKSNSTVGFQVDEKKQTLNVLEAMGTDETITLQAEHFTLTGFGRIENIATDSEITPKQETEKAFDDILKETGANSWQIVKEGYQEEGYPYFPDETNTDVRIQKNVVPTETENEFYVYLNVEPQLSWKEVLEMSSFWVFNSHSTHEGAFEPGEIQDNAEWISKNIDGAHSGTSILTQDKNLLGDQYLGKNFTAKNAGIESVNLEVIIQYKDGTKKTVSLPDMSYKLPNGKVQSVLVRLPFQDYYTQLSAEEENGKITVIIDAESFFNGTGDYVLRNDRVNLKTVTDPMGEYIILEDSNSIQTTNGSTASADNNTIQWKFPENKELPSDFSQYEVVTLPDGTNTVYWKNAYEMVYKIRLDVTKKGFQSCAEEIWSEKNIPGCHYLTNKDTTLKYTLASNPNNEEKADFRIPEVKGLLYDVEFQKVDQNGDPVEGAKFQLTGTYYGEDILKEAVSDEEGYVKFRNLPYGVYQLEETEAPEGYVKSYEGDKVTLCYTTDGNVLKKDHNNSHLSDKPGDIANALNSNVGIEGKIVNESEEITPGPDPGYDEKPDVPHQKQIDWLGDGGENPDTELTGDYFYRLYLNVTGIPDKIPEGADIIFVLDMSTSMSFNMAGEEESIPANEQRLAYVKSAATQAIKTIQDTCNAQSINNINIGLVTFNYGNANHEGDYENGTKILSEFTNDYNALINTVNKLGNNDLNNRTNYEAAFAATDALLDESQQENKYVVFITDGETNGYTDGSTGFAGNNIRANGKETYTNPEGENGNTRSLREAQDIAKTWEDLSGFYTIAVSSDIQSQDLTGLGPNSVSRLDLQANDEEAIRNAFYTVVSAITKQICNVTITDTLSQYVEFTNESGKTLSEQEIFESITGENIALKVTKTLEGETPIVLDPDSYSVAIDQGTKQVKVTFGENYFLEPDATYTISFNVKLTDQAFKDQMEDVGDRNTDYRANKTSSEKIGHFSNNSAEVSYSTVTQGEFQEYSDKYEKPVVQVQKRPEWQIFKESKTQQGMRLEGAEFVLKNGDTIQYKGISIVDNPSTSQQNEQGYIQWKDGQNNLVEENEIPAGVYTLEETKAPIGYSLSSVTWKITIKNMEAPEIIPMRNGQTMGDALTSTTVDGIYIFTITNIPVYSLPSSGGPGIFWYTIGGVLLMMAGTLILYKSKNREVLKR